MPRMKSAKCETHRIEFSPKEREMLQTAVIGNAAGSILSGAGILTVGVGAIGFLAVSLLGTAWYINSKLENPLDPNNAGGQAALDALEGNIATVPTDPRPGSILDMDGRTIYGQYLLVCLWRKDARDALFADSGLPESDRSDFNGENFAPDCLTAELVAHQIGVRITAARRKVLGSGMAGGAGLVAHAAGLALEGQDYYTKPEDAPGYESDPLLDLAAWRTTLIRNDVGARVVQLLQGKEGKGKALERLQKDNPDPVEGVEYISAAGTSWLSL